MSSAISGLGAAMAPPMVSGASMQAPPQQKMSSLYSQIDTGGTGSINQSQFSQAFQTMNPPAAFQAQGASAVWSKLDPGNTGQVTQQDFVNGMKSLMVQYRKGDAGGSITPAQTAANAIQSLNDLGNQPLNIIA